MWVVVKITMVPGNKVYPPFLGVYTEGDIDIDVDIDADS